MVDGDHYRGYTATRNAIGNPTTTMCADAELEELLDDADAMIHEFLDVDAKQTRRTNTLAKIESDLVLQGVIRLRMSKEMNLVNLEFLKALSKTLGNTMDGNPQLTAFHEKLLNKWLFNKDGITVDSTDREDDYE